jgi:hypothetical protein
MSNNILNGHHLNFDFTLVPIGSRYWITNAKVGSRYLTQFQNQNEQIQKVQISVCSSDSVTETPGTILINISGVKFRITLSDGKHNQLDLNFTYEQFKSMMNRCSVWIIRNPLDRFKSGAIQKIKQFYLEMHDAYLDRPNSDWESVFFTPNRALHRDYPIDWNFFLENYPDSKKWSHHSSHPYPMENIDKWLAIWKQFCEYTFLDLTRYSDVAQSFSGDVHTQPYLYHLKMFFEEIGLLKKLTIIDIEDLDSRADLFETEMGKTQYKKLVDELKAEFKISSTDVDRTEAEIKDFLRETLGRLKDINYKSIEDYFTKSDIYRWELVAYLMLLEGKLPNKTK